MQDTMMPPTISDRKPLTWLQKLIEPPAQIIGLEARQRAQLVTSILLVMIVVGGLLLGYELTDSQGIFVEHDVLAAMLAMPFAFVFYIAARRGHINLAAVGLISVSYILFVPVSFLTNAADSFLAYAVIPLLLAAMMFSLRHLLQFIGFMIGSIIFFLALDPNVSSTVFNLTLTLILAAAVIVTYAWYVRKMEKIRLAELETANEALRINEAHLEERVADRTRDLTVAAEVSQQITRVMSMDMLLPDIVNLTRERFGLYYVSIFLYDAQQNILNLEAGSGDVGQKMLETGMQLGLADTGLVTLSARTAEPQIMGNVSESLHHHPHPLLPATRSEAALPMKVGNQLIGVLNLQSMKRAHFSEDDLRAFVSLAEQIAVAVRNAQLFSEVHHAREDAEKANVVKSQFLAAMSHELRTPLNAILNFTQFVSSGMLGVVNTEQTDMLDKVVQSGKHLLSLINDVLDISKIEAGALKLFIEDDVNMTDEVMTVIATAKSMLADKPVTLETDIDPDLPLMIGDKRRLRQVMLNLVSNACKFTEKGSVRITLSRDDDHIQFAVHDTGSGIDPADRDAVFTTFQQTQTGLRQGEGTGLGLPISLRLAEIHQGTLWFDSVVGVGSSFYMRVPIHATTLMNDLVQKETDHVA